MITFKHTPHPWAYRVSLDGIGTDGWEIMGEFAEAPLAVVPFWPDDNGLASAEAEANARLMTAAPELLQALEKCIERLQWIESLKLENPEGSKFPIMNFSSIRQAQSAIAKARKE